MAGKLDTAPRLKRADDVYQVLMDAQAPMSSSEADKFRARLILILANQVGDDDVVIDAIKTAAAPPPS